MSITAQSDTVNLGPWTGSLATGTGPLDLSNVATFTGYTGTITVTANGDDTDAVAFSGTAGNVLQVSATPPTISTDQNTAVSARINLTTSLAGAYTLSAAAPKGWGVAVDGTGKLTIIPGPGAQSGTYPILVVAQSSADSGLVAQTIVNVTITPTQPGLTLIVAPDPLFTVPFDGVELPTAFRATIENLGPGADTYNLTFSNLPSSFTLLNSGTSVTVPAGQTGFLGLYLQPNPALPIPPVGSQVSFTVAATSTTNPTLTKTQTVTFTMPAIDGVTATVSSSAVTSTSGGSATTILTLTNVGNVAETVTPTATLPSGVTASGFTARALQPGQATTETITLSPDSTVALNTLMDVTITATFGPASAPLTTNAVLSLVVRSAQVVAVQQAANAVSSLPNSQIGGNLSELADALAALQAAPADATLLNRVQLLLGNLGKLIQSDPALDELRRPIPNAPIGREFRKCQRLVFADRRILQQPRFHAHPGSQPAVHGVSFADRGRSLAGTRPDVQPATDQPEPGADRADDRHGAVALGRDGRTRPDADDPATGPDAHDPGRDDPDDRLHEALQPGSDRNGAGRQPGGHGVRGDSSRDGRCPERDRHAGRGEFRRFGGRRAPRSSTPRMRREICWRASMSSMRQAPSSARRRIFHSVSRQPRRRSALTSARSRLRAWRTASTARRVSLLTVDGVALPGRTAASSFEIGAPVSASVTQSTTSVPPGSSSVTTTVTVTDQLTTGTVAPAKFGDIQVFYSAANSFGLADNLDGAVFVIENTSGTDITNGVLSINPPGAAPDSFNVGTIPAGGAR